MPQEPRTFSKIEIGFYVMIAAVIVFIALSANTYLASILAGAATLFILATIRIQVKRYRSQKENSAARRQNLYPLIGYIFLLGYSLTLVITRLPDVSIVALRMQTLAFSATWQWGVLLGALGFIFLAVWSWNFIKLRPFLRAYVVLLAIAVVVSTLGSFIFSLMVFGVVEKNNLRLMEQGSASQQVVMVDRENTALILARTIANDSRFLTAFRGGQQTLIEGLVGDFFTNAGVDILKVYNADSAIVAAPTDDRDQGRVANADPLITYVLKENKHVKTFDKQAGVLSPLIISRAIAPIMYKGKAIGAVEVGYTFDTAFVDYSKKATGLETTVYTGDRRSATTITTADGVSRWAGSQETDARVLKTTLTEGAVLSTSLDRLGVLYYSAFVPIRDVNGVIIGMVSVGSPTNVLFEDTRQQLLSTFIIVTLLSLLVSYIGYRALRSLRKGGKV